jgi:hypothetical protein
MSYPHNWTTLSKNHYLHVLIPGNPRPAVVDFTRQSMAEGLWMNGEIQRENALPQYQYQAMVKIPAGNYSPQDILNRIKEECDKSPTLKEMQLSFEFNVQTQRVQIYGLQPFVLACYEHTSLLQVLGYGPNMSKFQAEDGKTIEYENFGDRAGLMIARNATKLEELSTMFVYSDISDHVLVGDTQAPLLGYIPIVSKFGQQADWCLNPVYYVPVNSKMITNISIRICTDTGDTFPFKDEKVMCRHNFRRRNKFY